MLELQIRRCSEKYFGEVLGYKLEVNFEALGNLLKLFAANFEAQLARGNVKLSIAMDGMVQNPMGLKNFAFGNTLLSAGYIHGLPFLGM